MTSKKASLFPSPSHSASLCLCFYLSAPCRLLPVRSNMWSDSEQIFVKISRFKVNAENRFEIGDQKRIFLQMKQKFSQTPGKVFCVSKVSKKLASRNVKHFHQLEMKSVQ